MIVSGEIEHGIREVVAELANLPGGPERAMVIGTGDDLFRAGLTSHASVNVMIGLEDRFDIEFPDDLLQRATFASIGAIGAAIEGLRETVGAL